MTSVQYMKQSSGLDFGRRLHESVESSSCVARSRRVRRGDNLAVESSRTSPRCRFGSRLREEDPRDRAHGWRGLSGVCAGLPTRARVEHTLERESGAPCFHLRRAIARRAARFDRGSQAHTGDARADLHEWHATQRCDRCARSDLALHESLECDRDLFVGSDELVRRESSKLEALHIEVTEGLTRTVRQDGEAKVAIALDIPP